ncbi:hypothetical protein GIB67_007912 [Kingdonia uniflora]|uniref:TRF2/HOY1 PH-like domain-containing protein n=1 Tax=Kingdonia uniflora TaxID=39325 RepID=A0A7J7PAS4_9MAGN|nr:hypothetical protein GIB67_007912 [Kingdonia uniflora]
MVQLMNSGNYRSESDKRCRLKYPSVKLEIDEPIDEEQTQVAKRSKLPPTTHEAWNTENSTLAISPSHYNPLDEPSPLGLRLRKSPSLLDLIQMRLSQGNSFGLGAADNEIHEVEKKKDLKGAAAPSATDKLKASNFPASLLRIGTWECVSRYEGDLVAKCYFAKHKLVWEVLDGGLKSKMEIQWSDIMALKANCSDTAPGTLDLVLSRQPLFFRETNPQPRKHTLWQATSDFTGGQASLHRRHFLQCPQGLLSKHFEKLMQCDTRLNWLSQQPEIVLENPYFEPRSSVFEDLDESKCHTFDQLKSDYASSFSSFRDASSPSAAQSSSSKFELHDPVGRHPDQFPRESPSPSSVMDSCAVEENGGSEVEESKGISNWDQFKVPGIDTSMSMNDLMNHIGNCISEQMTSGNPLFSERSQNEEMLDDIAQHLLGDTQFASTSDEQSLMSRVNSLCCLLQRDPSVQNIQVKEENNLITSERVVNDCSEMKMGMTRKDSLGDLLLHLPRIASLPQFLFNIPEDGDSKDR